MKFSICWLIVFVCFFGESLWAQPSISDLNLRGIQIGASTSLTLSGTGLSKETRVFLPFQVQQETVAGNGRDSLTVKLTLGESIQPGLYPLRVYNEKGISSPAMIGVDQLPHFAFNSGQQSLPVALSGRVAGAQILKTSFQGNQGDLVVVEVESNRLGGKLRPVIQVYDSRGRLAGLAQPSRLLSGDSRCYLKIDKAGVYSVELHDFLFRAASPGFFRLKIGKYEYADLTMPVAVGASQKSVVRLIKLDAESEFLEEFELGNPGWWSAKTGVAGFSGNPPPILVSEINEYVESTQADEAQFVGSVPVGINGRLLKAKEKDRFLVDVQPNSKLKFDLFGQRLGSPIDAKIRILDKAGKTLAENDDRKGQQDALLNFTVPANVKQLSVEISDVSALGSKSHVYRLSIADQNQPEIELAIERDTFNIPMQGRAFMPVRVTRKNYSGPVKLLFDHLPDGYQISGTLIPAGSDIGLVTVETRKNEPAVFSIQGRIETSTRLRHFDVRAPESPAIKGLDVQRKWIAAAPRGVQMLSVDWKDVGADLIGHLGGTLPVELSLTRGKDVTGPVRIRLITNQKIPKKRIRENNKDKIVDDVENTIRATSLEIPTGAVSSKVELLIPNGIAEQDWEVLLVAELLSADKKNVLLSSVSKAVRLSTSRLANVVIKEGKTLTLPSSGASSFRVTGNLERMGMSFPFRVSLTGLPKGLVIAPQIVDESREEFDLTFELPDNAELRKIKSLNLEFDFFQAAEPARVIGKSKSQKIKVNLAPAQKVDASQEKKK